MRRRGGGLSKSTVFRHIKAKVEAVCWGGGVCIAPPPSTVGVLSKLMVWVTGLRSN